MKHACSLLFLLAVAVTSARAHFTWIVPADKDAVPVKGDPAASGLLADARAARANWVDFPGFTADLEINVDGKVSRGTIAVSPKGEVEVKVNGKDADKATLTWAKRELSSVVGHRLDNSAAAETACAFADENAHHPLGRAIRVLNDEFHSSYRIRDRQILVVNRKMNNDTRFTITVLENRVNDDKKYLPVCYVVNTWGSPDGRLMSSQTHHHTWQRMGKYDLPASLMVLTARPASGGRAPGPPMEEARTLKLTNHKLSAKAEPKP